MNFEFIEHGKTGGAARRLIRSHVMKGKNAGKRRPRPTRKGEEGVPFSCQGQDSTANLAIPCKATESDVIDIVSVPRTIGDSFSYFTFPCQVQPYMRDLIYQFLSIASQAIYPLEFCYPVNVSKLLWFEYFLCDEAFFHSQLTMSEVCIDGLLGRQETSPQALYHLSNTYRCIYQNLQKHGTPSNPTIAAVMSMAIHEDLTGQPARSKVHVDALQQMVKLRGGIAQFEANRVLLQKMCRADIEYALHFGSSPRFNRDEFPREMIQSMISHLIPRNDVLSILDHAQIYDPEIRCVVTDLMSISYLLTGDSACFKLEPYAYQEILISVCYRLLRRYSLADSGPTNNNENACHLGLLGLMTTMLFQNGRTQRLSYALLAEKLRRAIESCKESMEDETFLWILFIGGVSTLGSIDDRAWLLPQIKTCVSALNICSWQSALEKITKLPWIGAFHDKPGQQLWQAVFAE